MKLLLFVHTDPRKTNRSAVVRVQKGDYQIESNQIDSEIEIVWDDGEISKKTINNGTIINFPSPSNLALQILKAGTEPHLTIYLKSI